MDGVVRRVGPNELVIEPGEQHHETYQFIVSRDVQTVLVYSYFFNTEYSEYGRSSQGWTVATVHDMSQEAGCNGE